MNDVYRKKFESTECHRNLFDLALTKMNGEGRVRLFSDVYGPVKICRNLPELLTMSDLSQNPREVPDDSAIQITYRDSDGTPNDIWIDKPMDGSTHDFCSGAPEDLSVRELLSTLSPASKVPKTTEINIDGNSRRRRQRILEIIADSERLLNENQEAMCFSIYGRTKLLRQQWRSPDSYVFISQSLSAVISLNGEINYDYCESRDEREKLARAIDAGLETFTIPRTVLDSLPAEDEVVAPLATRVWERVREILPLR